MEDEETLGWRWKMMGKRLKSMPATIFMNIPMRRKRTRLKAQKSKKCQVCNMCQSYKKNQPFLVLFLGERILYVGLLWRRGLTGKLLDGTSWQDILYPAKPTLSDSLWKLLKWHSDFSQGYSFSGCENLAHRKAYFQLLLRLPQRLSLNHREKMIAHALWLQRQQNGKRIEHRRSEHLKLALWINCLSFLSLGLCIYFKTGINAFLTDFPTSLYYWKGLPYSVVPIS